MSDTSQSSRLYQWLTSSKASAIIIALTLLLLFLTAYIAIYNHPTPLDDFQDAAWDDYWRAQLNLYVIWSGRYFSNLVLTLNPIHWHSFTGYRLVSILLPLVLSLAIGALIKKALSRYTQLPARLCTMAAFATVFLILNNISSLVEAFYWYSSSMTYTISTLMAIALFAIFLRVEANRDRNPTVLQYILSILLVLAIAGCNETAMVFCSAATATLGGYHWQQKFTRLRTFYLLLFIFSLIGAAACILSPGTIARQAATHRNVWLVFPSWIYQSQKLATLWITDPFFLAWSALLLVLFSRHSITKPVVNLFIAFILPFAILFLLTFPAHFGLGTIPPPRVTNFIYVLFVFSWIFFLLHLSIRLREFQNRMTSQSGHMQPVALIALTLVALTSLNTHPLRMTNFYKLTKNLVKHIPQSYSKELNSRYALIQASTADTVKVPALLHTKDNLLYFLDIAPTPTTMTSTYYALYWHKSMIYAPPDSSTSR